MISQAISDAYLDDPKNKREVKQWLDTDDFVTVCDLASVNPDYMKKTFHKILKDKPAIARFEGRKIKDLIER